MDWTIRRRANTDLATHAVSPEEGFRRASDRDFAVVITVEIDPWGYGRSFGQLPLRIFIHSPNTRADEASALPPCCCGKIKSYEFHASRGQDERKHCA